MKTPFRIRLRPLLLLLSLLLVCGTASAQNISVKSFKPLPTDLTANLEGTKELDQNGEPAALIKVITTETGFVFDVGMLGVVRTVQQVGEIWVYVPHGIQRISINHQRLGRLAQPYYFPVPIEAARTYELELTSNRVRTVVEEDAGGGFLALKVTPPSAIVFVDDKPQALGADGSASLFLLYGEHTWRVEAPGYQPKSGTLNVASEETQTLDVTLVSTMSRLTLTTPMADAEIWVNNELKGTGRWEGTLPAGAYIVETRKTGHRTQRTTVTLAEEDEKTLILQAPEPLFGRLRAESTPLAAEVWLGDKQLGVTPGIFNDIPAGTHTFLFIKEGYATKSVEVTVEEGRIATASVTLTVLDDTTPGQEAQPRKEPAPKPQPTPKPRKEKAPRTSFFPSSGVYADLHVSAAGVPSYGVSVGAQLGGVHVEAGYDLTTRKEETVTWYVLDSNGTLTNSFAQYYYASSLLSARAGYAITLSGRLRLTPLAGVGVLAVKGTANGASGSSEQKTYVLSGTASLRAEYALFRHVGLYLEPAYSLPLRRGEILTSVMQQNPAFARWGSGLSCRAGISFNF